MILTNPASKEAGLGHRGASIHRTPALVKMHTQGKIAYDVPDDIADNKGVIFKHLDNESNP